MHWIKNDRDWGWRQREPNSREWTASEECEPLFYSIRSENSTRQFTSWKSKYTDLKDADLLNIAAKIKQFNIQIVRTPIQRFQIVGNFFILGKFDKICLIFDIILGQN